jgi:hypothetical protein
MAECTPSRRLRYELRACDKLDRKLTAAMSMTVDLFAHVSKSSSTDKMPVAHFSSPSVVKGYARTLQSAPSNLLTIPSSCFVASWGETVALMSKMCWKQNRLNENCSGFLHAFAEL